MAPDPRIIDFFDARANRYGRRNPFVQWMHHERAACALDELPTDDAPPALLDIGCGDGLLYRLLSARSRTPFYYFGLDPSAAMLAASPIPPLQRYCGYVTEWTPPAAAPAFDLICWLGVSTYLPPAQLQADLACAAHWLADDGKIIISFTHARSWENSLRRWVAPVALRLCLGRRVLSAPFPTFHYSPAEALALAGDRFEGSIVWLPPSIPFLHHFSPRLAIRASRALNRWGGSIKSGRWHSDFLVILRQK